jgi:tRNA1(Val) A37 N6-methylase TrmN6
VSAKGKAAERTRDAFLGGRAMLVQPRDGHRAGLDAALLQALVPASAKGLAIDLGTGVGTVAFSVAARAPGISVVGVERDPELVACGQAALALVENAGFAGRVRLAVAEIEDVESLSAAIGVSEGSAEYVLMNPPFDIEGRVSRSPDARRRAAHVGAAGLFESWAGIAARLLRKSGTLALIHRAAALQDVLEALAAEFGGIRVVPVHPKEGAAASRILVTARLGARAALHLSPGLLLHQADGAWTKDADAVLRGETELAAET